VKKYKWYDVVRGDLEAGEEALDDFILIKADGYPTYNFAHIIDDFAMGVTHLLRGDEFIASTPKFLSLYDALEIKPPIFATLPPILRDDRKKKLGKRDGAKDALEYRTEGYLSEAVMNYLILLGWHPTDDREVLTVDEVLSEFSLERIQKAGAAFDDEKLNWLNREYMKKLSDVKFTELATTFMPSSFSTNDPRFKSVLPLLRDKVQVFSDITQIFSAEGELAFVNSLPDFGADLLLWKKNPSREIAAKNLVEIAKMLNAVSADEFKALKVKESVWVYAEANGKGDTLWPLRVALSGKDKSPDPFICAEILGKEESLRRVSLAIGKLQSK
jgi:glutamyl-tRNA synthetase